ncbi:MAG: hypothetical protein J6T10_26785 [Methanobrevibacter sp.]|nr:hypothetical protein [Methanobrevibacter sp.]
MNMLNYELLTQEPTLLNILNAFKDKLLYNEINCCRIAIVDEFYGDSLQAKVNIANKMVIGMKEDGSQIIQDYAPITAKICFANNGISFPLKKGDCGLLLFNDRELESWYINGEVNQLAYDRSHSITDAIFIAGMFSQPNISNAQFIENCLHLFYDTKGIKITSNGIEIDGDLKVNGKIDATGDIVAGNISLQHHTHPGVEPGSGTTGQPQ